MRSLLLVCLLFFTSTLLADGPMALPRGTTRVVPSIGGNYNFYSPRGYNGRANVNSFGNYNYYNQHGQMYQRGFRNPTGTYRFQRYGRDYQ